MVYLLVSLSVVAAAAFAIGVTTDAPLAAVGGAVLMMILCAILDSIPALGEIRQGLPGTTRTPGPTPWPPTSTTPT